MPATTITHQQVIDLVTTLSRSNCEACMTSLFQATGSCPHARVRLVWKRRGDRGGRTMAKRFAASREKLRGFGQ